MPAPPSLVHRAREGRDGARSVPGSRRVGPLDHPGSPRLGVLVRKDRLKELRVQLRRQGGHLLHDAPDVRHGPLGLHEVVPKRHEER